MNKNPSHNIYFHSSFSLTLLIVPAHNSNIGFLIVICLIISYYKDNNYPCSHYWEILVPHSHFLPTVISGIAWVNVWHFREINSRYLTFCIFVTLLTKKISRSYFIILSQIRKKLLFPKSFLYICDLFYLLLAHQLLIYNIRQLFLIIIISVPS